MPGHDAFFGRGDCRADGPHLINKSVQHLPSQIWQTILRVVQRRDRGAHPARATSSDDAKLGEMTAQRIDHHLRWRTKRSRTLCSIRMDCWSTVYAVNLEEVLREVQPDRGNLLHGRFP